MSLGSNHKLLGGYVGLATSLALAIEYTKDGSPHVHGLVALSNLYSSNTLLDIAHMLKVSREAQNKDFVNRFTSYVNQLQRSRHFEPEKCAQHEDVLEDAFHCGQHESQCAMFRHLCSRPSFLFESSAQDVHEGSTWKKVPQSLSVDFVVHFSIIGTTRTVKATGNHCHTAD